MDLQKRYIRVQNAPRNLEKKDEFQNVRETWESQETFLKNSFCQGKITENYFHVTFFLYNNIVK